jgi:hypothetical protein
VETPAASGCVCFVSRCAGEVRERRGADGFPLSSDGREAVTRLGPSLWQRVGGSGSTAIENSAGTGNPADPSEKTSREYNESAARPQEGYYADAQEARSGGSAAICAETPRVVESRSSNPTNRLASFSCDGNESHGQDGYRRGRSARGPFTTFPWNASPAVRLRSADHPLLRSRLRVGTDFEKPVPGRFRHVRPGVKSRLRTRTGELERHNQDGQTRQPKRS